MSLTPSTMLPLGTEAPDFRLPDTTGAQVGLHDFEDATGLLVVFMCNHCPYVHHVQGPFNEIAREYAARGIAVVGINANDGLRFPDDDFEGMKEIASHEGYVFPYLHDESQGTAKAYHAACTPDFFLFDGARKLIYRGQMDDSRPGNGKPVSGGDLRQALDALLEGSAPPATQRPSSGCNIKWKPGNEPDYFG